jgi:hypothetical protein
MRRPHAVSGSQARSETNSALTAGSALYASRHAWTRQPIAKIALLGPMGEVARLDIAVRSAITSGDTLYFPSIVITKDAT